MILYHGSNVVVKEPKLLKPARRLDFGNGFYLTSNYDQAARWSQLSVRRRGAGSAYVSVFSFSESELDALHVLKFVGANAEWLTYISDNRFKGKLADEWDIVIGPVANDTTMPTLRLFFANVLTVKQTIENLMPQNLKDQYAFKTQTAIDLLEFKEVLEA